MPEELIRRTQETHITQNATKWALDRAFKRMLRTPRSDKIHNIYLSLHCVWMNAIKENEESLDRCEAYVKRTKSPHPWVMRIAVARKAYRDTREACARAEVDIITSKTNDASVFKTARKAYQAAERELEAAQAAEETL